MGLETEDINQHIARDERESERDHTEEDLDVTRLSNTSNQLSRESSTFRDQSSGCGESSTCEDQSNLCSRKRKEKLDETLATYKHKRMKKQMPADVQIVQIAEKELELKEQMVGRLEAMEKDHRETMLVLTNNLKTLSDRHYEPCLLTTKPYIDAKVRTQSTSV